MKNYVAYIQFNITFLGKQSENMKNIPKKGSNHNTGIDADLGNNSHATP